MTEKLLKPDLAKVAALRNFKKATTIKELRSFLGLINYCRGFIPNLAEKSRRLTELLKGESKRMVRIIELDPELTQTFESLKITLSEETIRAQPDFTKEFILTTGSSEYAIGVPSHFV